ncbi:MAG: hypothetical protein HYZ90_05490, partial [Candidatus Omnitrophica bacterium]|nr:hypothetical protein [Candidatus Omnitrophota bacterium]
MIEQFLKRLAQTLDQEKIPYMIIGGQAAVIYGRPRFTQDVDITLGVDTDQFEKVLALCRSADLKPRSSEPRQFAEETKVLPAEDPISKLRVDFIFSNTPYERQAIDRTQA